jgi:hypothetical protein
MRSHSPVETNTNKLLHQHTSHQATRRRLALGLIVRPVSKNRRRKGPSIYAIAFFVACLITAALCSILTNPNP